MFRALVVKDHARVLFLFLIINRSLFKFFFRHFLFSLFLGHVFVAFFWMSIARLCGFNLEIPSWQTYRSCYFLRVYPLFFWRLNADFFHYFFDLVRKNITERESSDKDNLAKNPAKNLVGLWCLNSILHLLKLLFNKCRMMFMRN